MLGISFIPIMLVALLDVKGLTSALRLVNWLRLQSHSLHGVLSLMHAPLYSAIRLRF